MGNGGGTFQTPIVYAVNNTPTHIAVCDFNADVDASLACDANSQTNSRSPGGRESNPSHQASGVFSSRLMKWLLGVCGKDGASVR